MSIDDQPFGATACGLSGMGRDPRRWHAGCKFPATAVIRLSPIRVRQLEENQS
ncbi:hypothetical protein [Stieleria magnilauensis]|uniref:hypothetical protein n=1 Tax=Stieleria magnilauensis TaxID=2527963 RepID=UPI003AF5024E